MINTKKLRKIATPHGIFYWKTEGKYGESVLIYSKTPRFLGDSSIDGGRGLSIQRGFSVGDTVVTPSYVRATIDNYFQRVS